jgi:hypothetical protein
VQVTRVPVDDGLIEAMAALSATEYGTEAAVSRPEHLRWKYLECPAGVPAADLVWDDTRLVGRIVHEPREFRSRGGDGRGVNPIDLLIDPAARSPRSFVGLMQGLRRHDDAELVFLVPNDTSAPLYDKLLKFPRVGTLALHGLPLRPGRVLATRGSRLGRWLVAPAGPVARGGVRALGAMARARGIEVRETLSDPAALDRLVAPLGQSDAWVGVRDHGFHEWRFRAGPVFRYRIRYAYRRGELVGYVVSRVTDFDGLTAAVVLDCVIAPESPRSVARALLADVVRDATRADADLVAALSFGDHALTRGLRGLPLVEVPARFWPQAMPLLADWVEGSSRTDAPKISLTLADMDVF